MTTPYKIHNGNSLEVLKTLDENSIDSIVCDPPYELGFMNKKWDSSGIAYNVELWKECLRVLKPGGHLLAFSGSRTYHRMAVAIEDAGFDIRDQIMWVYGSGFPKSLNVSKAIDKKPEAKYTKEFKLWLETQIKNSSKSRKEIDDECGFTACSYCKTDGKDYWSTNHPSQEKWLKMKDVIGLSDEWDWIITDNIEKRGFIEPTGGLAGGSGNTVGNFTGQQLSDNAISIDAQQWNGWGTALKPAHEPICLARKPFDATVAGNVMLYGTGAINIDGCRVELSENDDPRLGGKGEWKTDKAAKEVYSGGYVGDNISSSPLGRFPANFIHDGSDEVVSLFPDTSPSKAANRGLQHSSRHGGLGDIGGNIKEGTDGIRGHNDDGGSAARFFYCAKASKRDRDEGLDGFEIKQQAVSIEKAQRYIQDVNCADGKYQASKAPSRNHHPTVKPTTLMQYLCRLITPPNGIVLDPFMVQVQQVKQQCMKVLGLLELILNLNIVK